MVGSIWFGLVWSGLVWFGLVWLGLVWFGLVWSGLVWYGLVWFSFWVGVVRFGTVLVWFGFDWFGLVFGFAWFGLVRFWFGSVGSVLCGSVWFGFGLVRFGSVRFDLVLFWYGSVISRIPPNHGAMQIHSEFAKLDKLCLRSLSFPRWLSPLLTPFIRPHISLVKGIDEEIKGRVSPNRGAMQIHSEFA